MKPKRILKILAIGIIGGFIGGLVKTLLFSLSHQYIHHRMYRLILFNLAEFINKGAIYGITIAVGLILFITAISFLWQKTLLPFLDIKVNPKRKTNPLLQGLSFILIFVYLIFQIFRHIRSPIDHMPVLLGHSLFALLLFIVALRLDKIDLSRVKPRLIGLTEASGTKIITVVAILVFAFINLAALSQKIFVSRSRPNVLLLLCDTLRADHLGCYGYARPTSPHIDEFASEALLFENAMSSSPWTKPSMGNLFTSLYPHQHQAFYWEDNLQNGCLTLAEIFRNFNYSTFAIQTNVLITQYYNFHQGFQHFDEIINEKAEKVTEKFNSWVRKKRSKPFFAYLHFMDVHLPYEAPVKFNRIFEPEPIASVLNNIPSAYEVRILNEIGLSQQDKQHFINMYDAEIRYFDYYFGQIIDNLKKLGLFEDTIIVLAADHGEEFSDHNGFEHGHTLYNELIHIPLIIKYSSKLQPKRIKTHVKQQDLTPTLLKICRIKKSTELRGRNLILNTKSGEPQQEEIFFEAIGFGAEKKGIVKDGWKLIENTGKKDKDAIELYLEMTKYIMPEYKEGYELYNINQDFQEKNNLINDRPEIFKRLKPYLELFKSESFERIKSKDKDREKKLKDLKSLGYVK